MENQLPNVALKDWVIVQFTVEKNVATVPSLWLENGNCLYCNWPKKDARKLILNRELPQSDWSKYLVTIVRQYDNYTEAINYEKMLSDAGTDEEVSQFLNNGKRKRKPIRFTDSSSDDNDGCPVTPPPKIEHTAIACTSNTLYKKKNKKTTIYRTSSQKCCTTVVAAVEEEDGIEENLVRGMTPVRGDVAHNPPSLNADNQSSYILGEILKYSISNHKILELLLKQQPAAGHTAINNFDLVPKRQFRKYKRLCKFDDTLRTNQVALIQNETALYLVGGNNYKEHVRRGLRKIFDDELAIKCSWTGRKNNHALQNLHIMQVLKTAVRKKFFNLSDADFQNEVSAWFRQATLRYQRRSRHKGNEQFENLA